MSDWVAEMLGALTMEEKMGLLSGSNLWETRAVERLGIPALKVTDGPNGARGADGNHGPTSTSFPVGAAMGATFDPDLIESVGRALAHETRAKGASVLLGPTVNIPRVPNAGRNFECFSEDPYLSGRIAAGYIRGIQSEGVGACIKHFVCNDQETDRFTIDARVDEAALREVYLEPFRIAVEESKPWAAMSAYNTINGVTASENPLLDDVLRDDFGFDGAVISDWFGTYGPGVVSSGLDLEMPGPARWMSDENIRAGLESGAVEEADIDRKAARILALIERTEPRADAERADERDGDRALSRKVAAESIVMLTNRGALPLAAERTIAVIGEGAKNTPHQGGGSSAVNAHRVVSILDGIRSSVPAGTTVTWSFGCASHRNPPQLDASRLSHGDGASGFLVEYFRGRSPGDEPVRVLATPKTYLAFFGDGDEWVDHDDFSVRMSGEYRADAAGVHTFVASGAGRLRVWAGESQVVDEWEGSGVGPHAWQLEMSEGEAVALTVEYASVPGERWRWLGVGCLVPGTDDPIAEAVAAASEADVAIVVAGLNGEWESEGFDRPDLRLPGDQDRLIAEVAAAQPNTVVVLTGGSALEMPWLNDVRAVLHVWYGGQEAGAAIADVLLGRSDPGGRLPVTFPVDSTQHPSLAGWPGKDGQIHYDDSIHVGYRAFDRAGLEPLFRFGHGMSYTSFELSDLAAASGHGAVKLTANLANTGDRHGAEVVQVYARDLGGVNRRLVAFQKRHLDPGESTALDIEVALDQLRWWDVDRGDWAYATGALDLEARGVFGTASVSVVV